VEVRVLGPVEVADGKSVVRLSPTERTLLAALAARVGERVAADVLEEALWPYCRPPSARKTLQGNILRLRRVLGPSAIVHCSGGYRLDPDLVDVDARRVTALVTEASAEISRGHPGDAIGALSEARESFRGDPYEDVPDCALPAGEVHRLRELRAAMVEESVEAQLACGAGQQCIVDLEAVLESHPFRERAWGQLMLALYRAGRPADALAAYGRARQLLAAELGLEPGPLLRNLQHSILTHDPRLQADRAAEELGPSNLPAALDPIVGREGDVARLARLCRENRLVTLTGIGGIGKTRLAIEVAGRTIGSFEHGPYIADLAPVGDIELVPAALATALGLHVDARDDVIGRIRSALDGHPVVIVVDNCEHLLPGVAELVAGLLHSTPSARVMVTSREPLGLAGERVFSVSPLDVPPAAPTLDQIVDSGSGALFLARLPVNVATHVLDGQYLVAVGAICRSLDGIPLGLELAAARSRTLSLPKLAEWLDHSISALAEPDRTAVVRHCTMHAALDWGISSCPRRPVRRCRR
jgi:DNA-binding SARP family transcriptional activator